MSTNWVADAIPRPSVAASLRRQMDARLVTSFIYLVSTLSKAVRSEFSYSLQFLQHISFLLQGDLANTSKLTPEYYALHDLLYRSMKANEIARALDFAKRVSELPRLSNNVEFNAFPISESDSISGTLLTVLKREMRTTYNLAIRPTLITSAESERSFDTLRLVLLLISRTDPDTVAEYSALVSNVSLIATPGLSAGTTFPCYGCIYIRPIAEPRHWTGYLEHVVHEAAHHALYALWTMDEVIRNEGAGTFSSPLRNEPRPLSAIYHQMFVLARVIRVLAIVQQSGLDHGAIARMRTEYQNDRDGITFGEKFKIAADVIREHAILTDIGRQVFESCISVVETHPVRWETGHESSRFIDPPLRCADQDR